MYGFLLDIILGIQSLAAMHLLHDRCRYGNIKVIIAFFPWYPFFGRNDLEKLYYVHVFTYLSLILNCKRTYVFILYMLWFIPSSERCTVSKDFLFSECKCHIREPYAKDSGRLTVVGILIFMSRINFSLS